MVFLARALALALSYGKRTDGRTSIAKLGLDGTVDAILGVYDQVWSKR